MNKPHTAVNTHAGPDRRSLTVSRWMAATAAAIIALVPFHAFMTVWAASLVGHYTALRLWKEYLMVPLLLGAVYLLLRLPPLRRAIRREALFGWAAAYLLMLAAGLGVGLYYGQVNLKAGAYGLLLDSRFLLFFGFTWVAAGYSRLVSAHWRRLVLVPAGLAVAFAILQYAVLPAGFLTHFGYGPHTIPAIETIDQNAAYPRVQSTLRGANPLGAYLILVVSAVGVLWSYPARRRWYYGGFMAAALAALVFSFSRAAWIGAALSLGWLGWLRLSPARWRRRLVLICLAAIIGLGAAAYGLRHDSQFQNTFFHTDSRSHAPISSNAAHLAALEGAIHDIVHDPWGLGTGTAGPASLYNNHPGRIAENYYLQVGQEIGVAGMVTFVIINLLVARRLWQIRLKPLALVLLVSLAGISFVNLLSHAWTDDTLSYLWWGLAGSALGAAATPPAQADKSGIMNT